MLAQVQPHEVIGIDVGGTKLLTGVLDGNLDLRFSDRELVKSGSEDEVLHHITKCALRARDARPRIEALGLALPCTIDQESGTIVVSNHLPLEAVPIRSIMEETVGVPVVIDNDGNAAALAEHRLGAARGADVAVTITIGTGVGSGVTIHGRSFGGSTGAAPEIGHMTIDRDGPACPGRCGGRGCFEALVSGLALVERTREAAAGRSDSSSLARLLEQGVKIEGPEITRAALQGDPLASEVVKEMGRDLGVALASIANIFNPDVIVLGGGVSAAGSLLLPAAQEELRRRAHPPMDRTPIRLAELGPRAGMVGAALIAFEALGAASVVAVGQEA